MTHREMNAENFTIQDLENDYWPDLKEYPTGLVKRCHEYRKIPIKDLEINQLTTLLIQDIGSKWIMPTVIKKMENDILQEDDHGSCFLFSIEFFNDRIFQQQPELINKLIQLVESNQIAIEQEVGRKRYDRLIEKIKKKNPAHNNDNKV